MQLIENSLFYIIIILSISFLLFPILYVFYSKVISEPKKFKIAFNKFNENRINPIREEAFKQIYEYQNNLSVLVITGGAVGGGNQYDGDKLIKDSNNIEVRIFNHLNLKKQNLIITSLGYDFNNCDSFISFMTNLAKVMPNKSTRVFPVNQTWVIISKNNNSIGFSLDKSLFSL